MAGSPPMLKTRDSDDIKDAAKWPGFPFNDIGEWERSTDERTRQNARRGAYPYPRPPHLNQLVPKGGKGYPAKHVYDAMRSAACPTFVHAAAATFWVCRGVCRGQGWLYPKCRVGI